MCWCSVESYNILIFFTVADSGAYVCESNSTLVLHSIGNILMSFYHFFEPVLPVFLIYFYYKTTKTLYDAVFVCTFKKKITLITKLVNMSSMRKVQCRSNIL